VVALTPKIVKDGTPDQRAVLPTTKGAGGWEFKIEN
jgi:hypothetical protein